MRFQLTLPDIGEGVVEAEVQRWFVSAGEEVAEDQPLVEVMTDKATVTIPSPRRGRVARLCCQVGETARVHAPLVELEVADGIAAPPGDAAAPTRAPPPSGPSQQPPPATGAKALATPAVRAMARSLGIDVHGVHGTGKGGRVTKEDLEAERSRAVKPGNGGATPFQAPSRVPAPVAGQAQEERIPLRGLRKRMAENMARSTRTAAHFTFVEQADVSELVRAKHRMADAARPEGVHLTYLAFVVKAVVAALKKFPELNASLDEERNELVVKRWYDIGVASATEQGLTVPVIRGADRLSLLDVAREISRLARDAKAGASRPEDMGGSTFTVTSLGALGGLFGTPVLNHPEVGILGVHRIRPTPVVRDGQIVVRDVLHLSMTGDHRVVDGQAIAAFTYQVVKYLEDPSLLFMQMV